MTPAITRILVKASANVLMACGLPVIWAAAPSGIADEQAWKQAAEDLKNGRWKEAAALYAQLGASAPSGPRCLEAVRALVALGDPFAAHRIARQDETAPMADAQVEMARILTAQKLGDSVESATRLRALMGRPEPGAPYLSYLIARHYLLTDQPCEVRPLWPQLRQLGPLYPEAFVAGYESADAQHLTEEAAKWAATFLTHAPSHEKKSAGWFREMGALRRKFPAPFRRECSGVVRVPMMVDPLPAVEMRTTSGVTVRLAVDTGADALYLDAATARRLNLDLGLNAGSIQTLSKTTSGHLTVLPELSTGGLRLQSITTIAIDWRSHLESLRAALLKRMDRPPGSEAAMESLSKTDGFISASLLSGDGLLWFDVPGRTLVLAAGTAQAGIPRGAIRGPLFGRKRPWVPVVISGKSPVLALVDTGHNAPMTLDEGYRRFAGIGGERVNSPEGIQFDAAGVSAARGKEVVVRLNLWAADGPEFANLPATITRTSSGDLHNLATCAVLGWEIWKQFSPALDFNSGELFLMPPVGSTDHRSAETREDPP